MQEQVDAAISPPPRGTRPSNRRDVTVAVATELFHRRGYAAVTMGEIAAAMNVGASSIYRHFPSKIDLLVAAVHRGLDPYLRTLEELPDEADLHETFRLLATCALDNRALGVLWQREARNLDAERQRPLRDKLVIVSRLISERLSAARPELRDDQADTLSWCIMGAIVSIGFHSAVLPREEFVDLLAELALAISGVSFPAASEGALRDLEPRATTSRRESLIVEATQIFAERGFAGAALSDIGDAAGITGPSVYGHFQSKQDLLAAVVKRGTAALEEATLRVLDADLSPADRLPGLVDSYVASVNENRFAIRILLSEMNELPDAEREESLRYQRAYVGRWVDLLRELYGIDDATARIRAQAVLLVVNDAVQTPHLRVQPDFAATIGRVARALVAL
jgi:AcrR family transcriptional regulator